MILRTLVLAVVLAPVLTPGLASAMCSGKQHQAMSCADGNTWDDEKQTCVPVASS